MENALAMRVLHGARDLRHQAHDFARIITQGRPDFLQAAARRILHAEEGHAVLALSHFVDGQNVGMIEARRGFRFAPETRQRIARVGVITQDAFERDDATRMPLSRAVDDAHPAAPDLFENFVIAKPPMSVADRNGIEGGPELIPAHVLLFFLSSLEEAGEAETVRDTRDGVTTRTFVRRGSQHRQVNRSGRRGSWIW